MLNVIDTFIHARSNLCNITFLLEQKNWIFAVPNCLKTFIFCPYWGIILHKSFEFAPLSQAKSSPFIIVKKFNHNHWFALNVITITLLVVRYDSITLYSIQANNWGKVGMKNWNINSILAIKLHPLFYRIFCTFDLVVNERIKCQLSSQLLNVIGNLMT